MTSAISASKVRPFTGSRWRARERRKPSRVGHSSSATITRGLAGPAARIDDCPGLAHDRSRHPAACRSALTSATRPRPGRAPTRKAFVIVALVLGAVVVAVWSGLAPCVRSNACRRARANSPTAQAAMAQAAAKEARACRRPARSAGQAGAARDAARRVAVAAGGARVAVPRPLAVARRTRPHRSRAGARTRRASNWRSPPTCRRRSPRCSSPTPSSRVSTGRTSRRCAARSPRTWIG